MTFRLKYDRNTMVWLSTMRPRTFRGVSRKKKDHTGLPGASDVFRPYFCTKNTNKSLFWIKCDIQKNGGSFLKTLLQIFSFTNCLQPKNVFFCFFQRTFEKNWIKKQCHILIANTLWQHKNTVPVRQSDFFCDIESLANFLHPSPNFIAKLLLVAENGGFEVSSL